MDDAMYAARQEEATKSHTQIDEYVVRLEKGLAEQTELIRTLNARLERVTFPEADEAVPTEDEPNLVPLAFQLRMLNQTLVRNNHRIHNLIERIQL